MADYTIQLRAAGTAGGGDNEANIDVPEDGRIEAILINADISGMNADAESGGVEISFGSVSKFNSNDARGVIATARATLGLLTSGAGLCYVREFITPNLRVNAGERIYVHTVASAGVTVRPACILYMSGTSRSRGDVQRRG